MLQKSVEVALIGDDVLGLSQPILFIRRAVTDIKI